MHIRSRGSFFVYKFEFVIITRAKTNMRSPERPCCDATRDLVCGGLGEELTQQGTQG
jgi:hypothetical protein